MMRTVELSRDVEKAVGRLPKHVVRKLLGWVDAVERFGLEEVRRIPGFHDEPLHGARQGQRSIRLSRAWRAVYVVRRTQIEFVLVEEVTHHDY